MKCPNCKEDADFDLVNTVGDNNDGIVYCNECGKLIATFNLVAPYV